MKSTETARAKSSSGAAALDASAVFGSIFPHWETASYSGGLQECQRSFDWFYDWWNLRSLPVAGWVPK
jgi:hypothetical protein